MKFVNVRKKLQIMFSCKLKHNINISTEKVPKSYQYQARVRHEAWQVNQMPIKQRSFHETEPNQLRAET